MGKENALNTEIPKTALFALATYQAGQRPEVGLAMDSHLYNLHQALLAYRRLSPSISTEKAWERAAGVRSMLDLLNSWFEVWPLLLGLARFLKENGENLDEVLPLHQAALLAPVPEPGKMINVGLNFYDHAREMGLEIPSSGFRPNFFWKGGGHCIIGPSQKIRLSSDFVDWEAEPALIIGRKARNVAASDAMQAVAGFTCHNDVTDRNLMLKPDGTLDFLSGKSRDTFAPLGPWIIPKEFVAHGQELRIRCVLNNRIMQDTGTDQLIWGPERCIAYLSTIMTLDPGDVIALGTGAGVGWAKGISVGKGEFPKIIAHMRQGGGTFLRPGDRIGVEIDQIGKLENEVEAMG
jgi:2-keto-4-pentenoate hydratase/2-oxohepta-3-ene-1,7-dioic acid hydratase in catechol pathway